MTVYKYLGWGKTDENGVAKLDHDANGDPLTHSYTGVGAGEIDVVASLDNPVSSGSIVSETFSVMDTLLYDTGTDPSHNIWTGSTSNLTRGSEYSRLEESTIGTPVQINTVMPTGLWVLTMSIKRDGHSTNWDITILNNNVSVFGCATPTNDVWTDITLVYDGSFIYYFENGSTTPTKKVSVMIDDSKTTTLRLQTPQDITYLDFKDLIVLREGQSNISIGSSNPIIQSGDTTTINGSLYESGLIVQNATLDVYKNGTKVGTASTGDSGVASYTYSGTGAGATEFQFRYGSILSETYSIFDCLCYDGGVTGDKSNSWTASSGISVSTDDTGTLLSASTNQTYTSSKLLTGDFEATFQATNNGSIRIGFNKASDSTVQTKIITPTIDGLYYYKINRIGSTWRFQYSSDGTNWTDRIITVNNITDEDCYFLFSIEVSGSTRTIKYKDLRVYPI